MTPREQGGRGLRHCTEPSFRGHDGLDGNDIHRGDVVCRRRAGGSVGLSCRDGRSRSRSFGHETDRAYSELAGFRHRDGSFHSGRAVLLEHFLSFWRACPAFFIPGRFGPSSSASLLSLGRGHSVVGWGGTAPLNLGIGARSRSFDGDAATVLARAREWRVHWLPFRSDRNRRRHIPRTAYPPDGMGRDATGGGGDGRLQPSELRGSARRHMGGDADSARFVAVVAGCRWSRWCHWGLVRQPASADLDTEVLAVCNSGDVWGEDVDTLIRLASARLRRSSRLEKTADADLGFHCGFLLPVLGQLFPDISLEAQAEFPIGDARVQQLRLNKGTVAADIGNHRQ